MLRTRVAAMGVVLLAWGVALADSVGQIQTGKRISSETVALIDPESGLSLGGGSTDVRVAPGDILTFVFTFTPVPWLALRGTNGYVTEYIPPNTEVVGARIIDREGRTVRPRRAGLRGDGWGGRGSSAGDYDDWGLVDGSMAQLYCDTGIFFSTDPRTARVPDDELLRLDNGIDMDPQPTNVDKMLNLIEAPPGVTAHTHNRWDWIQAMAYGTLGSHGAPVGGDVNIDGWGNTPHRYGSPIAGPDTWYGFDTWESAPGVIEPRVGVDGPWQRIAYPGSETCTGSAAVDGGDGWVRVGTPTMEGRDLSVDDPLPPDANAVRFAIGELVIGEEYFAEISLRVLDTPLDPAMAADVSCGEVFGGDASAPKSDKDSAWREHVSNPGCLQLNLLFDLWVDRTMANVGERLTYTLRARNLSLAPQDDVVVTMTMDAVLAFVSATGDPARNGQILTWDLGTMQPSDELVFTVEADASSGPMAVTRARYDSATTDGFVVAALTNVGDFAVVDLGAAASPGSASACDTVHYTATVASTGTGPASCGQCEAVVTLPAGWTVVPGSARWDDAGIGEPTRDGDEWTFDIGALADGDSAALELDVEVDCAAAPGIYTTDVQTFYVSGVYPIEDAAFGVAPVVVDAVLSGTPEVDGPILPGDDCVSGSTSEPDASLIEVIVNGIARGQTFAAGGRWTVCGLPALFGGQEITATATAVGELTSPPSIGVFVSALTQCNDRIDNDGDGLVDFGPDPGCAGPVDSSEADLEPQCGDGVDNDDDGATDFPADSSCADALDTTEDGPAACANGLDDDGDTLVDFPFDPGCAAAGDSSEISLFACGNGLDDDGDGRADFPMDPGCHAAIDTAETDTRPGPLSEPRILVVFDTSGSMNWDTCGPTFTGGDGSGECPGVDVACEDCAGTTCGNGSADDSRMASVKRGLYDTVAAFGEVGFALMRFHQTAVPFRCPRQNAGLESGTWQGAGASPCTGYDRGDLLVGFAPGNANDLVQWMDGTDGYGGTAPPGMDVELRGSGATPLAGTLASALDYLEGVRDADDAGACRPYRVILVTDGAETCGGDPVARAASLAAAGIPVTVIGFVAGDPVVAASLDAIAEAGDTGEAILVEDEVSLSLALADIVAGSILLEVCNGQDDDCDGEVDEGVANACGGCGALDEACNGADDDCDGAIDEDFALYCDRPAGHFARDLCANPGEHVCDGVDDDCDGVIDEGGICGGCVPGPEICNGRDDDCDGVTDEDLTRPCGWNLGICTAGTQSCADGAWGSCSGTPPEDEACNGLDDDCDGVVDGMVVPCGEDVGECQAGAQRCSEGEIGPCVGAVGPAEEVCDGLDNDCDGAADEGDPGGGEPCGTDEGECSAGIGACLGGSLACSGQEPVAEICDGLDNDCDGAADDGIPVGEPCGSDVGECEPGTVVCLEGALDCEGEVGPADEVCNGVDDDCDGLVDDGLGVGDECGDEEGACQRGRLECVDGSLRCVGGTSASQESCDCTDEDCDGAVDEDPGLCPAGTTCLECGCRTPCDPAVEFFCPFGLECRCSDLDGDGGCDQDELFCLGDRCAEVRCEVGLSCDPSTGACVDRCAGVVCDDGLRCDPDDAACLPDDCYYFSERCAEDEVCTNGACTPDPCDGVECGTDRYCRGGDCVAFCDSVSCGRGERCVDGACLPDRCARVSCAEWCDPATGDCAPDPCKGVNCPLGRVCDGLDGECVDDPCGVTRCPETHVCDRGVCSLPAGEEPPPTPRFALATGGGGCACSAGDGSGQAGMVGAVLLCLVVLLTRRMRVGVVLLLVGALGGCRVDPYCFGDCEAAREDGGPGGDAGAGRDGGDGGADPPCDPARVEVCNGVDDDCDGEVDEEVEVSSDEANCGACGHRCTDELRHAFAHCEAGACVLDRCEVGWYDLEGDGTCDYACRAVPATDDSVCDLLDDDCDGEVDEDVALISDRENCGACGVRCEALHSIGACADGECEIERCDEGFHDVDGLFETGCEYSCTWLSQDESCNLEDDDCDGEIDEGDPGGGGQCGSERGACVGGTEHCVGGRMVCEGEVGPRLEQCDGADDDCDGDVDEDFDLDDDPEHCGDCATSCLAEHLFARCDDGACAIVACEAGWVDRNGEPGDGCEYECTVNGDEACNGLDDDCDGGVDEGLAPPQNLCNANGACAGTAASCGDEDGWICDYGPAVQRDALGKLLPETWCDDLDNDCDGQVDEAHPLVGTPCWNGEGACRRVGTWRCDEDDPEGQAICSAPAAGQGSPEACNGIDDDCDGLVDDGATDEMVHVEDGDRGLDFWIDAYETSRPDSTADDPGTSDARSCSRPGVLPWTDASWEEADLACTAAGKELCSEIEWQAACEGLARDRYPYGDEYVADSCNGADYDPDCAQPDADEVRPTGTAWGCPAPESSGCASAAGALDLSGNVQEWTATRVSLDPIAYRIRGGANDDIAPGLACDFDFSSAREGYRYSNLGFRCCAAARP
ncbi:MAG: SUMF1/EgtB/PvdO family nonheme iron enzyme [Deltaproteobacteria bacterium]|nr:SUMF1/EgtB/PvdO family nonheme iron enzyme [Deltaproteobacteria bacterium]